MVSGVWKCGFSMRSALSNAAWRCAGVALFFAWL
jgi:hypothetical protein